MRHFIIFVCIAFCMGYTFDASAKRMLPIKFEMMYGQKPLRLSDTGTGFRISAFRFYISGMEFYDGDKVQWKITNSFHLIDASVPSSLQFQIEIPPQLRYTSVKFILGIDSATNVSGVLAGDLDPSKGMYWAWQSGYINFKLEGASANCPTRNNEFQFHLGGYASPFASVQTVTIKGSGTDKLTIRADVAKFELFWYCM